MEWTAYVLGETITISRGGNYWMWDTCCEVGATKSARDAAYHGILTVCHKARKYMLNGTYRGYRIIHVDGEWQIRYMNNVLYHGENKPYSDSIAEAVAKRYLYD